MAADVRVSSISGKPATFGPIPAHPVYAAYRHLQACSPASATSGASNSTARAVAAAEAAVIPFIFPAHVRMWCAGHQPSKTATTQMQRPALGKHLKLNHYLSSVIAALLAMDAVRRAHEAQTVQWRSVNSLGGNSDRYCFLSE